MKRFHFAVITLIACVMSCLCFAWIVRHTNLKRDLELNAAYERGVRWGEREKKFLVVLDGVTNKFDTMMEAVTNASVGAEVVIPWGTHDVGTNVFILPNQVTLSGATGGTTTIIGGNFHATNAP